MDFYVTAKNDEKSGIVELVTFFSSRGVRGLEMATIEEALEEAEFCYQPLIDIVDFDRT